MTERRIRPEEVGLTAAARILAFLNAAQTPAEIAEAVEIAGEHDIGLGVARRLLDPGPSWAGRSRLSSRWPTSSTWGRSALPSWC